MESFPSIQVPLKDIRLLLRRINKCIRDLGARDDSLSNSGQDAQHITDLIYSKVFERLANFKKEISKSNNENENENLNIFNELI